MSKYEYGLVGYPLSHSFSPRIHAALGDYRYELFQLDESAFESFFASREFLGVNVTIPYKKRVIEYLDELTTAANEIGAVNTVACRDGRLCGTNTDFAGFLYMASRAKISFKDKKVLVLGSGGASATVTFAAKKGGAREVIVVSRTGAVNYENVYDHTDADVIVNTTPVGMYPNNSERLLDISRFPSLSGVLDIVYNPLRTGLILDALALGIPCENGLSMLVAQAAYAYEFFFGKYVEYEDIEKIIDEIEREKTNIVLVGMPGCGKSSIGKVLAESLGREFVDADEAVSETAGRSPAEIIERDGEEAFRKTETSVLAEICKTGGRVISCGGGVVTRDENYAHLKQNGEIYYIKRELSSLSREGRPLSAGDGALERLYAARKDKYERFADHIVENDSNIFAAAEKIKKLFTKE